MSQYLNFTEPDALRKLSKFQNIVLKIATNDFHSKGYLFKHGLTNNIIIGSSNLTANALGSNKEWNLKVSTTDDGQLYDQVINEFDKELASAKDVTADFINPSEFAWESRSNRKLSSAEIKNVIESKRILLFVKKEDGEGTDFYYLGDVSIAADSIKQDVTNKGQPIFHFRFLSPVAVKPPTSGGGYKATHTVVRSR
ncbi:DUF3427 domain-containing protein [Psychrobacter piechaudii]|uniref:Uncharacterized protein n=1 Tax=Psychrobacter piechaudii TaxID=1945521 RepID=A0A1R4GG33_9GAMM|nr:DUF3427 domain-containing protein [Psychrobacter piechaudii]SJM67054.1 hypothetical protein A1232T_00396 [Psychrobacter piechaudii]